MSNSPESAPALPGVTADVIAARASLEKLFAAVEVNTPPTPSEGGLIFSGFGKKPWVLFRGEALYLLRDLQTKLAESALARGGPSRKAIERMLIATCKRNVVDGPAEAIQWLTEQLSQPLQKWWYAEPIDAHCPGPEQKLGSCKLLRELPSETVPEGLLRPPVDRDMRPPFIAVQIEARDPDSARLLARDRIDEAVAILVLASGHRGRFPWNVLTLLGDRATLGAGRVPLIAPDFWDPDGGIHPYFRAMSDAAAREEDARTDWERRVLASARWFARGAMTFWPSEALTACMTALESIFIGPTIRHNKGSEIADRFTERFVARGWTAAEQREWFRGLYRARNDAIHEGRNFVEDLQVDRLVDLTSWAVRWGAWHLDRFHSDSQAPCETFDQVMAHDLTEETGAAG